MNQVQHFLLYLLQKLLRGLSSVDRRPVVNEQLRLKYMNGFRTTFERIYRREIDKVKWHTNVFRCAVNVLPQACRVLLQIPESCLSSNRYPLAKKPQPHGRFLLPNEIVLDNKSTAISTHSCWVSAHLISVKKSIDWAVGKYCQRVAKWKISTAKRQ